MIQRLRYLVSDVLLALSNWICPKWTQEELDDIAERAHERWLSFQKLVEPPLAECGRPYPCEHAPDGGNHPAVGR